MNSRLLCCGALVAGLLCLFAAGYSDADPRPEPKGEKDGEVTQNESPHQVMGVLDGRWVVESRVWTNGSDEPEITKGRARNTRILEGKFLRLHYTGILKGKPYYATGLMGYCLAEREFQLVWISSAGTRMNMMSGQASEDGKTITFKFTQKSDKGDVPCSLVYTIQDPNNYVIETWSTCDGQKTQGEQSIFKRLSSKSTKLKQPKK